MVNLERLRAIRALSHGLWREGGDAADAYVEKLTAFTDGFPGKEEALRDALAEGDAAQIAEQIGAIRDMLFDIGADAIAAGCVEKIAQFPTMTAGSLEAYVEGFLGAVSALSVDIQMAIYGGESSGAAAGTAGTTAGAAAEQGAEPQAGTSEREVIILAVDDNSFFLSTLKSYLQDTPYKLTCVTAGSVALRFLEKHLPDLFILDIDMPEMDGYELADKIREKGIKAPIIFLTGNASKEYVIKAVKAGAADFIIKPISKEQALEKIAKYV